MKKHIYLALIVLLSTFSLSSQATIFHCFTNGVNIISETYCGENAKIIDELMLVKNNLGPIIDPGQEAAEGQELPAKDPLSASAAINLDEATCVTEGMNTTFNGSIVNQSEVSTYRASLRIDFHYTGTRSTGIFDTRTKVFNLKPNAQMGFDITSSPHYDNSTIKCSPTVSITLLGTVARN